MSVVRLDSRILTVTLMAVGGAVAAMIVVLFPAWSAGVLLTSLLVAVALPALLGQGMKVRLAVFFSLLAVVDFVKRATFIFPEQAVWSQYLTLLVPMLVYTSTILLPWLGSRYINGLSGVQKLGLAYIVVALVNTWLSPGFSLQVKAVATAFLILPWSMLIVAAAYPDAISPVSRLLTFWGVVGVLYALIQFLFGPTVVEIRWAEAAGQFSIGASHLAAVLYGTVLGLPVWRVNGLQPDAFTFGMFCLTALTAVRLLYASGEMGRSRYIALSLVLGLGILISLVRTIWLVTLVAFIGSWIASRYPRLFRSWLILPGLAVVFILADLLAGYFYQFAWFAGRFANNPLLARVVTLGTLEARKGALEAILEASSAHWLLGLGYGASSWVSDKFGEVVNLPANFAAHNAVAEQAWYVGLPGLALFLGLLIMLFQGAGRVLQDEDPRHRQLAAILTGYLLAMFVSGLGNGGVFLGYPFFFFAGALAGKARMLENKR